MWSDVCATSELGPAERREAWVEGERLVVWRTASGLLRAAAARCPHQWADLAVEGFVEGDQLVCAAHGWRFDADGQGYKRSMTGRDDPKSPLCLHRVREHAGRVEVAPSGVAGHR